MCIPLVGRVEVISHSLLIDYLDTSRLNGNQMLKPLKQSEYKMRIVEDLGMQYPSSKSKKKARMAIFECPICKSNNKSISYSIKSKHIDKCFKCGADSKSTHKMSYHRLYGIHTNMINRCYDKNNINYKNYGAKGIVVCNEWLNNRELFFKWALNNGHSHELTLDRIDSLGNYEPNNCRWETKTVQSCNQVVLCKANKSGYRGVFFYKRDNCFRAVIQVDKKKKLLGKFKTAIEGAIAYDNYVIENDLPHSINGVINDT